MPRSPSCCTRGKEFGFSFENLKLDYAVAYKRSRDVSVGRVKGVQFLMKKNKIDVYQGVGKLKDATHVEIAACDECARGGRQCFTGMIESKNIIIATGARARSIPGVEVDGQDDHHLSPRAGDDTGAQVDRHHRRRADRAGVRLRVSLVWQRK